MATCTFFRAPNTSKDTLIRGSSVQGSSGSRAAAGSILVVLLALILEDFVILEGGTHMVRVEIDCT